MNLKKVLNNNVFMNVLAGLILAFFVPGMPNLWNIIHTGQIRHDMIRELMREAELNKTVFFAALKNDEQVKKTMKLELKMTAESSALESFLGQVRVGAGPCARPNEVAGLSQAAQGNNFTFFASNLPADEGSQGLLAAKKDMDNVLVTFENMEKSGVK